MKFIYSVKTVRYQGVVFTEAVIEEARSPADYGLRRFCRVSSTTRRPREAEARCEIEFAAGIGLVFITQAIAKRQIRPIAPVVLPIKPDIGLRNQSVRVAVVDAELRCAAPKRANALADSRTRSTVSLLRSTKALRLNQRCAAIPFNTR